MNTVDRAKLAGVDTAIKTTYDELTNYHGTAAVGDLKQKHVTDMRACIARMLNVASRLAKLLDAREVMTEPKAIENSMLSYDSIKDLIEESYPMFKLNSSQVDWDGGTICITLVKGHAIDMLTQLAALEKEIGLKVYIN